MLAISMFGPMFTWLMIFITHIGFRRQYTGKKLAFRMWGAPCTSLLGAVLMLAALATTLFTPVFRPTLTYGLPFLVVLSLAYAIRFRKHGRKSVTMTKDLSHPMSTVAQTIPAPPRTADPLLVWRKEFPILAHTTYMISHSLGPMPLRAEAALREYTQTWATRGIRAWEEGWWDLPITCGDLIGNADRCS